MDDALLEDDDSYKDDGEDDLDEAALLGLSDDELLDNSPENNQDSSYSHMKEDFSGRTSGIYQNNNDEDVLEVNIDADLDSFIQEDLDSSYNEEIARKPNLSKDLKYQENLIPITLVQMEKTSLPLSSSTANKDSDSTGTDLLDDESEDDENFDDDRRGRFKSERSNIITLTPAKVRAIPDSLESVLNSEDRSKAQEFMENERRKKMFYKSKNQGQFHNNLPKFNNQGNQRFSGQNSSHKILVNPHFAKNLSIPASTPAINIPEQRPQMSNMNVSANYGYPQTNYPLQETNQSLYGLGDMFISPPPPILDRTSCPNPDHFIAPPMINSSVHSHPVTSEFQQFGSPAVHASHPVNTMPSQLMHHNVPSNQPVSNVWNQPPPSFVSAEPQPLSPNYKYSPMTLPPANYNTMPPSTFPNSNYQPPIQQQPLVGKPEPFFTGGQWNQQSFQKSAPVFSQPVQNVSIQSGNPQFRSQQPQQQHHFHPQQSQQQKFRSHQLQHQQQLKRATPLQVRQLIKRSASNQLRTDPAKQKRYDDGMRKPNFPLRKVNSNIKEIPLVDNLTIMQKKVHAVQRKEDIVQKKIENKAAPDDEDEATKDLCKKIEEQKKLREQIMKFKEERRRQMAAQRIQNLKTQGATVQVKPNIKARVGVTPAASQAVTVKQKLVVCNANLQSKPLQNVQTIAKKPMSQRIGTKNLVQFPKSPLQKKVVQLQGSNVAVKKSQATVNTTSTPVAKSNSTTKVKTTFVNRNRNKQFLAKNVSGLSRLPPPPNQNADFVNPWIRFPGASNMSPNMNRLPNWIPPPRGCPPERFPIQPFDKQFGPPMQMQNRMPFPPHPRHERPNFPPPLHFGPERLPFFSPRFGPFGDVGPRCFDARPFCPQSPGFNSPARPYTNRDIHPRHGRPQFQKRLFEKNQVVPKPCNKKDDKKVISEEPGKSLQENKIPDNVPVESKTNLHEGHGETKTVIVNNLSSSTSEVQLRKLGNSIGPVQKVELEKQERRAVIVFRETNDALKFQSKYQRYMLDLSLIEVSLQL